MIWTRPGATAPWPVEQWFSRMWIKPALRYAMDVNAGRIVPGVPDVWYERGLAVVIALPITKATKREVQASLVALRRKVAKWDAILRFNAWGWPCPAALRAQLNNVMLGYRPGWAWRDSKEVA